MDQFEWEFPTDPSAGVDLVGMSDMGGVKHFNVAVDVPKGDVDLLKLVLEGANKEVDESSEERKGGAGAIGKCFYSAGDEWVRDLHTPLCTRLHDLCVAFEDWLFVSGDRSIRLDYDCVGTGSCCGGNWQRFGDYVCSTTSTCLR